MATSSRASMNVEEALESMFNDDDEIVFPGSDDESILEDYDDSDGSDYGDDDGDIEIVSWVKKLVKHSKN